MEFITEEQIEQAVKQGSLASMECSLKHHEQGGKATLLELLNAYKNEEFTLHGKFCAACQIAPRKDTNQTDCSNCELKDKSAKSGDCCGGLWRKASHAWNDFTSDPSNANLKAFQDAENEICIFISKAIDKAKAELKKLDKPKLRDGDYGYNSHSGEPTDPRIYMSEKHFGCCGGNCNDSPLDPEFVKGNWLDDLQRNSEELREFTVTCCRGGSVRVIPYENVPGADFDITFKCNNCSPS